MIDIDIPYRPVVAALRSLIEQLQDRRELMASLAGIMHRAVEQNFADGGRPKWQQLQAGTIEARRKAGKWPGAILIRDGQLASSIQADSSNDQALVGTNVAYAAIQQFGGTTAPHIIRPRFKRALAFGGVVVRQVNHPGSRIPARPFLQLTEADAEDMLQEAREFIAQRLGATLG